MLNDSPVDQHADAKSYLRSLILEHNAIERATAALWERTHAVGIIPSTFQKARLHVLCHEANGLWFLIEHVALKIGVTVNFVGVPLREPTVRPVAAALH